MPPNDDAVTSRVVKRDREGERRPSHRVEREPMARVVDQAAWREERPHAHGDRDSIVPHSRSDRG